jgi:hypothetical protein
MTELKNIWNYWLAQREEYNSSSKHDQKRVVSSCQSFKRLSKMSEMDHIMNIFQMRGEELVPWC